MATWTFPLEHVDSEETHISNVLSHKVTRQDKRPKPKRQPKTHLCRARDWTFRGCRNSLGGLPDPVVSWIKVKDTHRDGNPMFCSSREKGG